MWRDERRPRFPARLVVLPVQLSISAPLSTSAPPWELLSSDALPFPGPDELREHYPDGLTPADIWAYCQHAKEWIAQNALESGPHE